MKRFLSISAVLIFICGCTSSSFDESVRKADERLGTGRTDSALKLYENIVEDHRDDPRSAAVCIQIAKIYADMKGDDEKAVRFYENVIGRYPITPSGQIAFEAHSRIMESRGDLDAAAGDMISLMKYFPQNADAYRVMLAGLYIAAKKYPEARLEIAPLFERKGVREEVLEAAAFTYAESYFIEGRTAEARTWLQTFIREFPQSRLSAEARLHLATTFEEMGRLGVAKRVMLSAGEYPNKGVLNARLSSIDERGTESQKTKAPNVVKRPKTKD